MDGSYTFTPKEELPVLVRARTLPVESTGGRRRQVRSEDGRQLSTAEQQQQAAAESSSILLRSTYSY